MRSIPWFGTEAPTNENALGLTKISLPRPDLGPGSGKFDTPRRRYCTVQYRGRLLVPTCVKPQNETGHRGRDKKVMPAERPGRIALLHLSSDIGQRSLRLAHASKKGRGRRARLSRQHEPHRRKRIRGGFTLLTLKYEYGEEGGLQ